MANYFLQTLIRVLSSIALLLVAANTVPSQSTNFAYDFYGNLPTILTYQGDAFFSSHSNHLRLIKTDDFSYTATDRTGRIMYSMVMFRLAGAQANFKTTLKFIIAPVEGIEPGEGLTFFVTPVGYVIPSGSSGGNFGIFNPSRCSPSVFAIEFDTTTNGWDPSYRHVGIDIGFPTSVNLTRVDDAIIGQEVTARINYVAATKLITVGVAAGSQNFDAYDLGTVVPEMILCISVSQPSVNIRNEN